MIKVCDAIMGSGKSSAAISMMNGDPTKKYIFITPYLEEAKRIHDACPALNFVEPSSKISDYGFTKIGHTRALIERGRNITTTHQAFLFYTDDLLSMIREKEYTIVIDESVNVLQSEEISSTDVQLLVDGGYLRESDGIFSWTGKEYHGTVMREILRIAKSRNLVRVDKTSGTKCELFYWVLTPNLIMAFKDVYILTYLFAGQPLHHFLEIYGMEYRNIGIQRSGNRYSFCEWPGYTPEYTQELRKHIHIYDKDNLNEIGEPETALSMSWFKTHPDDVARLKNNISNFFRNILKDIPSERRMWGSHKDGKVSLSGKGYTKAFIPFNMRATNELRNRIALVYSLNVYMNVGEKMFYKAAGAVVDEDLYALSTMIQWIWRSAIRDGEDIWIYVPSRRMRKLLINWIDVVSAGGDYVEQTAV